MASPLTVWSTTNDGRVRGQSSTYLTARSTATGAATAAASEYMGQQSSAPTFTCYEMFWSFDTSSIGGGQIVTTATLSLCGGLDQSDTDFILEVRVFDWSPTVTTATYRAGASLHDYARVASLDTSAGWATGGYNALTSDAAFLTQIAPTASTFLFAHSARQYDATAPSGDEMVLAYTANDTTGAGGTNRDPKLYVEWEPQPPDSTSLIVFGIC